MRTKIHPAAALLAAALLLFASPVPAQTAAGPIAIDGGFARATAPTARSGAAYLTITNGGTEADRLVAVSSPLSGHAELHATDMQDGVMRMHPVEGGVVLAPGETVALEPGGMHIMFMGLTGPFVEGESLPLTLEFERAGKVEVTVTIGSIAATGPGT